MKKYLTIAVLGLLAASCSSDNSLVSAPEQGVQNAASYFEQTFSNGTSMGIAAGSSLNVESRAGVTSQPIVFDIDEEKKIEIRDKHIELFPEKQNNLTKDYSDVFENFSHDFLYMSDGGTYDVSLLFTCWNNQTGDHFDLFWLDEDGNFNPENTLTIWKETDTGAALTSKRGPNYWFPEGNAGVRFTLPEGTLFGFYFYTVVEGTRHFSASNLNVVGNPGVDPAKVDVPSMVTYMVDGYQVISMDGTFPLTSSYDADVNDVVFLLRADRTASPDNSTLVVPVYTATEEIYCEADDFAMSNNVERYPEYYNIGNDPDRRVFVEKGDHLSVFVHDFDNLVYNEEYNEWTYETWVWLSELPETEGYIYGDEKSADWETFSDDNYLVGVSAYQGIAGQHDTGYVKTSIHIKEKPHKEGEGTGGGIIIVPSSDSED